MSDDNVARFLKKYADLARMEKPDIPERIASRSPLLPNRTSAP